MQSGSLRGERAHAEPAALSLCLPAGKTVQGPNSVCPCIVRPGMDCCFHRHSLCKALLKLRFFTDCLMYYWQEIVIILVIGTTSYFCSFSSLSQYILYKTLLQYFFRQFSMCDTKQLMIFPVYCVHTLLCSACLSLTACLGVLKFVLPLTILKMKSNTDKSGYVLARGRH